MPANQKISCKRWPLLLLALALLAPGACTPDKKAQEELQKEIKGLKTEIKALQEKMGKLEAGQQEILRALLAVRQPAAPPPLPPAPPAGFKVPPPLPSTELLTVSQLLKDKERYLGTRVVVRGEPGPVTVHRQSLLLKAPEGMVEVFFGGLPDVQAMNRLTSTTLDQPLTVTGIVNLPARGGGNLRITAEAVEF